MNVHIVEQYSKKKTMNQYNPHQEVAHQVHPEVEVHLAHLEAVAHQAHPEAEVHQVHLEAEVRQREVVRRVKVHPEEVHQRGAVLPVEAHQAEAHLVHLDLEVHQTGVALQAEARLEQDHQVQRSLVALPKAVRVEALPVRRKAVRHLDRKEALHAETV